MEIPKPAVSDHPFLLLRAQKDSLKLTETITLIYMEEDSVYYLTKRFIGGVADSKHIYGTFDLSDVAYLMTEENMHLNFFQIYIYLKRVKMYVELFARNEDDAICIMALLDKEIKRVQFPKAIEVDPDRKDQDDKSAEIVRQDK